MKTGKKKFSKRLLLGALGMGACFFLSACGKTEAEPVEITVIHGWGSTEKDHVAMRKIYSDFQKENPDVTVRLVSMPTSKALLRKVGDMILVGKIPDVVFFGGTGDNDIYKYMMENDLLIDLIPYLEEDSAFAENIASANLEYWKTEEGCLYSIADALMLSGGYWYNEDIFRQAGISQPPGTWEEFFEACKAIKAWSMEGNHDVEPLQVSAEGYLYFADHMLADQMGLNKISIVEEKLGTVIEALRKVYSFSSGDNENYSYRDETDLFNEGKLAIYINGVWGAPMIGESINAEYALLPADGGYSMSCESTGLGYVLGKTGIEKQQEASVRFLKYMLSDEIQERILQETEQVPANPHVSIEEHKENMPRFYHAAELVKSADIKIEVPENLWESSRKNCFEEHILEVLAGEMPVKEFCRLLE